METALRGTKKEGAKKTRSMPQSPELIKGKNDRGWRKKRTLAPFFFVPSDSVGSRERKEKAANRLSSTATNTLVLRLTTRVIRCLLFALPGVSAFVSSRLPALPLPQIE